MAPAALSQCGSRRHSPGRAGSCADSVLWVPLGHPGCPHVNSCQLWPGPILAQQAPGIASPGHSAGCSRGTHAHGGVTAGFGGDTSAGSKTAPPGMFLSTAVPVPAGLGDRDAEKGASPSPGVSREGTRPLLWLHPVDCPRHRRLRVPHPCIHLHPSSLPWDVAWGRSGLEAVK